tara:strand:- start:1262 stop:1756 length:495 start_codon:yes stop_codon:yes gene_type:complete
MVEQDWMKKERERRMTGEITLDVEPTSGERGDTIEYCFHHDHDGSRNTGQDLNFSDGTEWRGVKKTIALCREHAERGELYDGIVGIEKVWHDNRNDEPWVGTASLWNWSDYGGKGAPCGVEDCDTFVEDGQGSRIWEWDGCCDDCNEQYKNGEWTPDVEQVRGR